jgi:lysophospholipase L1-like esterase
VTLTLGANDYLALVSGGGCAPNDLFCAMRVLAQALADYQGRYDQVLSGLTSAKAGGQPPVVVVTTYYNPYDGASASGNPTLTRYEMIVDYALLGADGKVDCAALNLQANVGLNDIITCRGAAHGAIVADVYGPFNGRAASLTHPLAGGHHPNDEGYRVIAQAVIDALARAGL